MNQARLTLQRGGAGCGLGDGPVLRLEWDGVAAGAFRLAAAPPGGFVGAELTGAHPLRAGDELWYAVRPRFDEVAADIRDGFRAGCLAVDLVTADGRRLLDGSGQVDVDRLPADPAGTA
ncbi:MAG: hypothetical protein KJ792_12420, partial [Actinobacteria bacterium]|nr:hypothetical protein [Actinomycetota bacterium]